MSFGSKKLPGERHRTLGTIALIAGLLGGMFHPAMAGNGPAPRAPAVLIADFDGDGTPEALILAGDGSGMICRGELVNDCRPIETPKGDAYFALYPGGDRAYELLVLHKESAPVVCNLTAGPAWSCADHLSTNVGAFSERQTSEGKRAALVLDTSTGTQVCEWDGPVLSCRTTLSQSFQRGGTHYLPGQYTKLGSPEMLIVNAAERRLCTFDVGSTATRCMHVRGWPDLRAIDIQVGAFLRGGRVGLLLSEGESTALCRIDSDRRTARAECRFMGSVPPNITLKVSPQRGSSTETVEVIVEAPPSQRNTAREMGLEIQRSVRSAIKDLRSGSSTQQKIEEYGDDWFFDLPPVEVIGWPEPPDPHWDFPEPSPWFDGGFPPQTNHEISTVGAPGGVPPKEVCKKVCDRIYDAAAKACGRYRNSAGKAICYGIAATKYGACLAEC